MEEIQEITNGKKISALKTERNENKENFKQAVVAIQIIGEILVLCVKCFFIIIEALYRLIVPKDEKSVKDEIVLITGAGSGIGRELALLYASQGATVVCWDINEKNNRETVQEIFHCGYVKAHAYTCDVTNPEQVQKIANKVETEVGNVTILINNAGVLFARSFLGHTNEDIERIVNVNLLANTWVLRAFLPNMLKINRGHIVALSSMAGLRGFQNLTPYCATKFAIRGMMEALYSELHADPNCKLKLTTIFPYAVGTGMLKTVVIRFSKRFPMIEPKSAAKHIMSAQRRDVYQTTIPGYNLYTNLILELLPIKCTKLIADLVGTKVDDELQISNT